MKSKERVPVTSSALIQRINRKLKAEDEMLKKARTERAKEDLGMYHIVDIAHGVVVRKDVNLERCGRDLGVLKSYEGLQDDE